MELPPLTTVPTPEPPPPPPARQIVPSLVYSQDRLAFLGRVGAGHEAIGPNLHEALTHGWAPFRQTNDGHPISARGYRWPPDLVGYLDDPSVRAVRDSALSIAYAQRDLGALGVLIVNMPAGRLVDPTEIGELLMALDIVRTGGGAAILIATAPIPADVRYWADMAWEAERPPFIGDGGRLVALRQDRRQVSRTGWPHRYRLLDAHTGRPQLVGVDQ